MDERSEKIAVEALKQLLPLIESLTLTGLRSFLDGRVDNIAASQRRRGWSPTHVGDIKNDYRNPDGTEADILSKQADDALFVLAQQLPGDVTDRAFRDPVSPIITPAVRQKIDATSTYEEIAQAVTGQVYTVAESVIKVLTP